jgi:hypothetical protein
MRAVVVVGTVVLVGREATQPHQLPVNIAAVVMLGIFMAIHQPMLYGLALVFIVATALQALLAAEGVLIIREVIGLVMATLILVNITSIGLVAARAIQAAAVVGPVALVRAIINQPPPVQAARLVEPTLVPVGPAARVAVMALVGPMGRLARMATIPMGQPVHRAVPVANISEAFQT